MFCNLSSVSCVQSVVVGVASDMTDSEIVNVNASCVTSANDLISDLCESTAAINNDPVTVSICMNYKFRSNRRF